MKNPHFIKITVAMVGIILVAVSACSRTQKATKKAKINDVAVSVEKNLGYRVVGVGGKAPERVSHPFISVVPYVEIVPGKYRIDIEPEVGDGDGESFNFSPRAGITYRIGKTKNGTFTLIEDTK